MKESRNKVLIFDYWSVICFGFLTIIITFFVIFIKRFEIDFLINIYLRIGFYYIIYTFIKSITGIIVFFKKFFLEKHFMIKNKLFYLCKNYLLYAISLLLPIYIAWDRFDDPDLNFTYIFFGLSFGTYQIIKIFVLNIFVNMIGIPLWLFNYTFSKNYIKSIKKRILIPVTLILTFLVNLIVIYGLTLD